MNLSPMRYPGAKTKMLPILMNYLDPLLQAHNSFIDVFTGGGSVLLEIANKYPKASLYANDKDYWMYCFWNIVAGNDSYKLDSLLSLVSQPPTLDLFYKLRAEPTIDEIACAYRALFFNRTTFSGILTSGPIGGKEQKSKYTIDCRYNIKKLKDKILKCNKLLVGRTTVTNSDFTQLDIFTKTDTPVYCDPPYVMAGKALYPQYMVESQHQQLSNILLNRQNWVLSYDSCDLIRQLYNNTNIYDIDSQYCINGTKVKWAQKSELIILPKSS